MGADHSTALTFNLEETVWLDQGQRMKELVSLGLEPDIHIEEKSEYVAIKGGLRLKGEYLPFEDEENEAIQSEQDTPVPQYAEEHTQGTNGVGEIKHYFPVDVTIPLRRIHNLDDIYVQIEGFDYDLPESDCIQLTADISITGMRNEETPRKEEQEMSLSIPSPMPNWQLEKNHQHDEDKESLRENKQAVEETIETAREQPVDDDHSAAFQKVETDQADLTADKIPREGKEEEETKTSESIDKEESEDDDDDNRVVASSDRPELQELESKDTTTVEDTDEEESATELTEDESAEAIVTAFHSREEEADETVVGNTRDDIEADDGADEDAGEGANTENENTGSGRDDNALYLTKMMTSGEEEYSRVKMCIIQENESLDTIAERYELTISHLLRYNRLDDEHLEEGQILYIPASASRRQKHEK
ncbi:stage VI sporulation protein D [Bacillus piscicola]|uniref:stage VI sporulation protein D n=1 Tax=Bacillus piscicola TaxID=1632684 RepID=UPI001F08E856|nr:stage VI sporulation protein D [Bacillus piscicola]